jgi:hypothetical protein
MAVNGTDYDAPRTPRDGEAADEPLVAIGPNDSAVVPDLDDEEPESFALPEADLSGEELTARVIPEQRDEFTCSRCFLVHHKAQLARRDGEAKICVECAA